MNTTKFDYRMILINIRRVTLFSPFQNKMQNEEEDESQMKNQTIQ